MSTGNSLPYILNPGFTHYNLSLTMLQRVERGRFDGRGVPDLGPRQVTTQGMSRTPDRYHLGVICDYLPTPLNRRVTNPCETSRHFNISICLSPGTPGVLMVSGPEPTRRVQDFPFGVGDGRKDGDLRVQVQTRSSRS